jgi:hypothetical protein
MKIPEKRYKQMRAWSKNNKDKMAKYRRKWYNTNKIKSREMTRKYIQASTRNWIINLLGGVRGRCKAKNLKNNIDSIYFRII